MRSEFPFDPGGGMVNPQETMMNDLDTLESPPQISGLLCFFYLFDLAELASCFAWCVVFSVVFQVGGCRVTSQVPVRFFFH